MAELHRGITMTSPALALLSPADKCTRSNGADRNGSHTPVAKKTVLQSLSSLSCQKKVKEKSCSASYQMEIEHPANNHEILVSLNQNLILVLHQEYILCESVMQTPHH